MAEYRTTTPTTSTGPSSWAQVERVVALAFGILQTLLALRILLLLLDANRANGIVSLILNLTTPAVEPFRGILRLSSIQAGPGSFLDVAAIVALVGWSLIEALVVAIMRVRDRAD